MICLYHYDNVLDDLYIYSKFIKLASRLQWLKLFENENKQVKQRLGSNFSICPLYEMESM